MAVEAVLATLPQAPSVRQVIFAAFSAEIEAALARELKAQAAQA